MEADGLDRYFKGNSGDMMEVEKQLKALNADYFILENDISNERSVKDIFDRVIAHFGRVDILVNNAAAADDDTIETITQRVIDDTFTANVRGTLLMIREFINRRGDYGRIINFSTDAAQAFPGVQITYSASKAAIEAFTRNIAIGF
jgi:3-oxoacyl-[acyl-carrier protein] reductase